MGIDKTQKTSNNNIDIKKVIELLTDMLTENNFGKITVSISPGKIDYLRKEITLK